LLYEASSRFGGWIESKQIEHNGDKFIFEKGPRTLRLATGELKEMNSLQLVYIFDNFCLILNFFSCIIN
jgi:protoporphyrinogen oxidase